MSPINQHNRHCSIKSISHNRPRCLTWTMWNQTTFNGRLFHRKRQALTHLSFSSNMTFDQHFGYRSRLYCSNGIARRVYRLVLRGLTFVDRHLIDVVSRVINTPQRMAIRRERVIHVGNIHPVLHRYNWNESYCNNPDNKSLGNHASIKPEVSMDYSSPKEKRSIHRVVNLQIYFEMVEPLSDLIAMSLADVKNDHVGNSVEIGNGLTKRRGRTWMKRILGVRIRICLWVRSVIRIDRF